MIPCLDTFRLLFWLKPMLLLQLSHFSHVQTLRPHRQQPTSLLCLWDSPGKNTGVGCHFLLQCMKVKSESEVAQLCPTLSNPMNCSLPGSSIHGIFQARVLEWGPLSSTNPKFPVPCSPSSPRTPGNQKSVLCESVSVL